MEQTVSIDIVSDVVCPWCYIGLRRLDAALVKLTDIDVALRWRPFQLDPTIPEAGMDRMDYMIGKFGSRDAVLQKFAQITEIGKTLGIRFNFDAIAIAPNTLDAHRLIHWAGRQGSDTQDKLVRVLFSAFFEEGADIGRHTDLAAMAARAGMAASDIVERLAGDSDRETVSREIAAARQMGIQGVPCFLLQGKYAISGAHEPDSLAEAITRVAALET